MNKIFSGRRKAQGLETFGEVTKPLECAQAGSLCMHYV